MTGKTIRAGRPNRIAGVARIAHGRTRAVTRHGRLRGIGACSGRSHPLEPLAFGGLAFLAFPLALGAAQQRSSSHASRITATRAWKTPVTEREHGCSGPRHGRRPQASAAYLGCPPASPARSAPQAGLMIRPQVLLLPQMFCRSPSSCSTCEWSTKRFTSLP
ncbi:hypothetical protein GCM10027079_06460 [Sediminivirga luteola]|uniref:Uncharacterized protein n=1 Tax=Sediminivirga luteola TaxID=1774748 RepID=A0A8J2XKD4_9MICO|nr:hypothetical protein GCM10011333_15440 [Sediminivirga luteola]